MKVEKAVALSQRASGVKSIRFFFTFKRDVYHLNFYYITGAAWWRYPSSYSCIKFLQLYAARSILRVYLGPLMARTSHHSVTDTLQCPKRLLVHLKSLRIMLR